MHDGKLSNMQPKELDMYFEGVHRGLEGRAAGRYEDLTDDNLTFLEEATCDDAVAALKGTDVTRRLWNQKYGSLVKQLEWHFYTISDYVKFHASFAEKNPTLPCVMTLITVEDGEMSNAHPSTCHLSGGHYRGCDICNLLYALDNSRSQTESVESELKHRCKGTEKNADIKPHLLMFNGVGLTLQCTSWDETSQRPTILEVSGPLGVVLQSTDWDTVLKVERTHD